MTNTELLKTLKFLVNDPSAEQDMLDYASRWFIRQNPSYKQLSSFRDDVLKINNTLKQRYYTLVNDMMLDIAQNRKGKSLKEFRLNYIL
jgi:hypothetical protein